MLNRARPLMTTMMLERSNPNEMSKLWRANIRYDGYIRTSSNQTSTRRNLRYDERLPKTLRSL